LKIENRFKNTAINKIPVNTLLVEDGVGTHWCTPTSQVIAAAETQDKELLDEYFEGKVLMGLLLSFKHCTSSKAGAKVYSGSLYHSSSMLTSKRQRIGSTLLMIDGPCMQIWQIPHTVSVY
jgi:hypothetical protein